MASGRRVGSQADYQLLQSWLKNCDRLHDTYCRTEWSVSLRKIKLIDVNTCRVISYPVDRTIEYLALSYVWGKGRQKTFSLGSRVKNVPATILDAMEVTRKLGNRFLWVDSVCIDQKSSDDKAEQIALMSAIYRGAYATIVALNGRCADSGLPRVNATCNRKYPGVRFPQLAFRIGDVCLGTTMPNLRQQIERSTWATRAWTYQEALLSPRCIYFTQHQVYFECNILQCCESIDDSTSPFHSMTRETLSPLLYAEPALILGRGVFRNPFFGCSDYSISQSMHKSQNASQKMMDYREIASLQKRDFRGLLGYNQLLSRYSNRRLTNQSDALNAVSGILQQLQEEYYYENGFFYGMPCADMQLALLWKFRTSKRRLEFPSWTWAGHEGQLLEAFPRDIPAQSWLPTSFKVCKVEGSTMELLYEVVVNPSDDGYLEAAKDDQVLDTSAPLTGDLEQNKMEATGSPGRLFVKGIILRFSYAELLSSHPLDTELRSSPLLSITPSLGIPSIGSHNWRISPLSYTITNGIAYDTCWRDDDGEHTRNELNKRCDQMQDFLLVAREKNRHYLLLLQDHLISGSKVYSRVAVMCSILQRPSQDLKCFDPRHTWVILV
jgi:hypothetical protein